MEPTPAPDTPPAPVSLRRGVMEVIGRCALTGLALQLLNA